jgi:hypothetical protein
MKNRTATASENACAYSAAVIADAQAAIVRAIQSVRHAGDTRKQLKKQRESLERAKAR